MTIITSTAVTVTLFLRIIDSLIDSAINNSYKLIGIRTVGAAIKRINFDSLARTAVGFESENRFDTNKGE